MSKIIFEKGNVVSFETLPENSVALDGYVQGPSLDPKGRRFSFDHHTGCTRMVTKATCEQVRESIVLGLPVDKETSILINDIDADTVVSVWLLQHPDRVWEDKVIEMVRQIGLTDAHGPVFKAPPLLWMITPPPPWKKDAEPQSLDMLQRFLDIITKVVDGELELSEAPPRDELHTGYGWSARTGWRKVESRDGFESFYKSGYVLGFLSQPGAHGSTMYTVAKASDLVAAPLGPGSLARPVTSVEQFEDTILGELGRREQDKNPNQSLAHTWGGSTSVGGSPRNPDDTSSCLTPEEVLAAFQKYVA